QIDDRIKQGDVAPQRRQHVDRIESSPQKGQRRDDHQGDDLQLFEAVGPNAEDETQQAEGDRNQEKKRACPNWVQDFERNEDPRGRKDQQAENDRFGRGRADEAKQKFEDRHRRGEQFVDGSGKAGDVNSERGVRHAFGENRQQDQARHDERPIGDAVDRGDAAADRRTENDEIERRRENRGGNALKQRATRARELVDVDRADGVEVHVRLPTRLTKMSSREERFMSTLLKSTPLAASRRMKSATPPLPFSSSSPAKATVSVMPSGERLAASARKSGGTHKSGCLSPIVTVFRPKFRINALFSSTNMISPPSIMPMRSAISSASSR